jgi:hypothetical protein
MPNQALEATARDFQPAFEVEQSIVGQIRSALRKAASQSSVAKDTLARLTAKAFLQEFPAGNADNRLANAIARGIPARQKLLEAEGGGLSAEAAARHLGISKAAILKRYQKGKLLAWREERQNAVRFPVWQFREGQVLPGMEETLAALDAGSRLDDFGRILFFLSNMGFLGGERPLDLLRESRLNKVLQAAAGYGE